MPTYHYKCKACEHEFEEFQAMSEDPLVRCPSCGKKKLVRLITGAGLVFKGSGFYKTDYTKRGEASTDSGASDPDTPAGSSTGTDDAGSGGARQKTKPKEKKPSSTPPPPADKT